MELSKKFVAATDEVWRLQNGTDPECKHFKKIADVGHYRRHATTRQGIYVCTPGGKLLGSMNSHDPNAVLKMMNRALEDYAAMEREQRLLPDDAEIKAKTRPERHYPAVSLDLTMFTRDLPASGNPKDERLSDWNRDRAWFSNDEMRMFLPGNKEEIAQKADGDRYELPRSLVNRIARFSIIDTVKGQTPYFTAQEVADSQISVTVVSMTPESIKLKFEGQTSASSPDSWGKDFPHGIKTKMLGQATFDRHVDKFTEFQIVALGTRWGRTTFNRRQKQLEESPVGFVITMTSDDAPLVAPSFLFAYDAEWAHRP